MKWACWKYRKYCSRRVVLGQPWVRLPIILLVVSWGGKHIKFPVPVRAWELIWSRSRSETGWLSYPASPIIPYPLSRIPYPVSCQPAHQSFSTLRLNLFFTHGGIGNAFRGGVHSFIPPSAIGSVPSLLDNKIAYRWRSLPRVSRHMTSM